MPARTVVRIASVIQTFIGAAALAGQLFGGSPNLLSVVLASAIVASGAAAVAAHRSGPARRTALIANAVLLGVVLLGVVVGVARGVDSMDHAVALAAAVVLALTCLAATAGLFLGRPAAGPRAGPAWVVSFAVSGSILLVVFMGAAFCYAIGVMGRAAASVGGGHAEFTSHRAPDAARLESEEFNFRLDGLSGGWQVVEPRVLNPEATLALVRRRPEAYFVVIAERVGVEARTSSADLAEIARLNLQAGAERWRSGPQRAQQAGGIDGLRFETEAVVSNMDVLYVHWVSAHRGFLYQLITWGRLRERERVVREADALLRCFRMLQSDVTAYAADGRAIERLESEPFGYRVDLPEGGWRSWDDIADTLPHASSGALQGIASAVVVVPVRLPRDQDAPLEGLMSGLLGSVEVAYPGPAIEKLRPIEHGGRPGYACEHARQVEGVPYRCWFRVVKGTHVAWLLGGWTASGSPAVHDLIERTLAQAQLEDVEAAVLADAGTLSEREKLAHGLIYNEVGLHLYRGRNFRSAAEWFHQAFEFTARDPVILGNAVDAWLETHDVARARACLDRHRGAFAEDLDLQARQAQLLALDGDEPAAITAYAALVERGYRHEGHLAQYVGLLADRDRLDDAEAAVERYLAAGDTLAGRLLHAQIMMQRDDHERAIALLRSCRALWPGDPEPAFALVDTLIGAERHREAIDECTALLERWQDSGRLHFMKGYAELSLGWYAQAKVSFEAAQRCEPANGDIRGYVDHVSAMLGEGENSLIKAPIEPVLLPDALAEVPPLPAGTGGTEGTGATAFALRSTAVAFDPGRSLVSTERYVIDVLDAAGASRYGSFPFAFDPLAEAIFVNHLVVSDAAGREIARGRLSDCYVLDDTSSAMARSTKILNVPVPGLQPPCRVDLMVTRRDLAPPETFRFREHLFVELAPVRRSVLFVRADTAAVGWSATQGARPIGVRGGVAWVVKDLPAWAGEARQAQYDRYAAVVWLGQRRTTWEDEARRYLATIDDLLEVDPAVRSTASRLAPSGGTAAAVTLARFVQSDLAYQALEFGRRACIPNAAGRILENRYGDCKDHSLLLHQLLAAAGVRSHLALVRVSGPLCEELPSLDQFDHMVVYVPDADGGRFIDCTSKDTDVSLAVPFMLAGRRALVLDPESPRLVRIGSYAPQDYHVSSTTDMHIGADGGVLVEQSVRLHGYSGATLRSWLRAQDEPGRRSLVQSLLDAGGAGVRLRTLEVENLDVLGAPLVLRLGYGVPGCFDEVGGRLVGRLPLLWERGTFAEPFLERRHTPFEVHFPLVYSGAVRLHLPAGRRLADAAALEAGERGEFFVWRRRVVSEEGSVSLRYEVARRAGVFEAQRYPLFQRESEACGEGLRAKLILEGEG